MLPAVIVTGARQAVFPVQFYGDVPESPNWHKVGSVLMFHCFVCICYMEACISQVNMHIMWHVNLNMVTIVQNLKVEIRCSVPCLFCNFCNRIKKCMYASTNETQSELLQTNEKSRKWSFGQRAVVILTNLCMCKTINFHAIFLPQKMIRPPNPDPSPSFQVEDECQLTSGMFPVRGVKIVPCAQDWTGFAVCIAVQKQGYEQRLLICLFVCSRIS